MANLLPPRSLSHGAVPFLVYAATITYVAGAFAILVAFRTHPALQKETVARLASRTLSSPDETSEELQKLFIGDVSVKLHQLEKAYTMLFYTIIFLMFYWLVALLFAVGEVQWPYNVAYMRKTYDPESWTMRVWTRSQTVRALRVGPLSPSSNVTTCNSSLFI
jgi:hypothetical protein